MIRNRHCIPRPAPAQVRSRGSPPQEPCLSGSTPAKLRDGRAGVRMGFSEDRGCPQLHQGFPYNCACEKPSQNQPIHHPPKPQANSPNGLLRGKMQDYGHLRTSTDIYGHLKLFRSLGRWARPSPSPEGRKPDIFSKSQSLCGVRPEIRGNRSLTPVSLTAL